MLIPFSYDAGAAAIYALLGPNFEQTIEPLLAAFEEFTAPSFSAHTLRNGRETSIAITVDALRIGSDETLMVWFGIDRNSDDLFVQCCQVPNLTVSFHGPHMTLSTAESYKMRKHFQPHEHAAAAEHATEMVADFVRMLLGRQVKSPEKVS